jgi:hypothetical protein
LRGWQEGVVLGSREVEEKSKKKKWKSLKEVSVNCSIGKGHLCRKVWDSRKYIFAGYVIREKRAA